MAPGTLKVRTVGGAAGPLAAPPDTISVDYRRRLHALSVATPIIPLETTILAIHIRPALESDVAVILRFITELAVYEKAEHEVLATESSLTATLFGPHAVPRALICEIDNQPMGFAIYFFSYSTWLARNGLYLEDLYVSPAGRGRGAGRALLQHLARLAVERGCGRFEWSVLDWNTPAIDFYRAAGAKPQDEWIRYRMAGDDLKAFAASPDITQEV